MTKGHGGRTAEISLETPPGGGHRAYRETFSAKYGYISIMKMTEKIATTLTPDGCEMYLYRHDRDFSIKVKGVDLMSSRQHESELELARLGCATLKSHKTPRVLIGGLGLGYTLRQTLDMLSQDAEVVVAELLDAVVEWNREFLGELNGYAMRDKRVTVHTGDVVKLIENSQSRYDAILLDIDNGPGAFTTLGNQRLYSSEGIMACRRALCEHGRLAVWSAEPSKNFERILLGCKLNVHRYNAQAYAGNKRQTKVIWVASEDKTGFPSGAVARRHIGH